MRLTTIILAAIAASPAIAETPAEFYKGRTVNVVVGHEAGTGFDVYSRVLIRHMPRYVPGAPGMIVQNMPGASGVASANWLANIAPKDGTVMVTFSQNVPLEPLFGNAQARFDATKMVWIGNMESSVAICGVSKDSGVTSFDDLLKREVVFGATGPTGPLVKSGLAVKNILGAKLKVITGYKGSADVKLAMQRGEVKGICGLPWSTVKSFWAQELASGDFKAVIQLSGERSKALGENVAYYADFLKTEEQRQLAGLLFGVQELGRIYAAPPGTPADRVEALRTAFMATMKDADFLADARKTGIDVDAVDGATTAKMLDGFLATPPEVVAKAKALTTP